MKNLQRKLQYSDQTKEEFLNDLKGDAKSWKRKTKNMMKHLVTAWKHRKIWVKGFLNIGRTYRRPENDPHNTIALIVVPVSIIGSVLCMVWNIAAAGTVVTWGIPSVAVANMGWSSVIPGIYLDYVKCGRSVEMSLHANNQLNWVFTGEKKPNPVVWRWFYYAAIVLPKPFSRDIMSLPEEKVHAWIFFTIWTKRRMPSHHKDYRDKGASAFRNR